MNEIEAINQALLRVSTDFKLSLTPDNGGIDLLYWEGDTPITVHRWASDTFGFRLADDEKAFAEDIAEIARVWYEEKMK